MASLIFFFYLLLLLLPFLSYSQPSDTETLTQFRLQTDPHGYLLRNWSSGDACSGKWQGIRCIDNRVVSVSLDSLDLRGPIDCLARLDQLRILNLHGNRLNGTLVPLSKISNLKLVYLAGNDFSGEIPSDIGLLNRLLRLDLSNNNLRGRIPNGLSNLIHLVTLRLQNNALSGPIPVFSTILNLRELNVSNNEFYGKIPENLQRKFGAGSFRGNAGLCGENPFPVCSFTDNSSVTPSPPSDQSVVPSNPSSEPDSATVVSQKNAGNGKGGLSTGAIVAIVVGDGVLLLLIAVFLTAYYCGRYSGQQAKRNQSRSSNTDSLEKKDYGGYSPPSTERSKLVFFDRRNQFELEHLLRASAEMLGKGSLGTVYKAILEDGSLVAVKRLKDANPSPRKEFEQYMDIIGKLRHPNIVRMRAYYYAKEEKLLIYDYLPNGSLYSLLHGNRGPGRSPLDWTTRISLVLGAARGLAKIHEQYSYSKIPHGNVKSSNILLDKNGISCISDFGLALLLNPIHATTRLGGYRAPEQVDCRKLSQKADVYGFGVLILEILTGRAPAQYPSQEGVDLPKWVQSIVREEWTAEVFDVELLRYKNIEEEMVAMLQVGLACVVQQPEQRPTMSQVVKMIEDIRVEQSPLGEDWDESRNSMSPSVTTEDALASY